MAKLRPLKKHSGKYLGHSFGSNRSQNLLRFEMYEIIEFWSKLGWNNLFVPQNLRVLLISLRHIMYCFVFRGPYDSPLTLKPRTSSLFSLFHRTINCVLFWYFTKLTSATKLQSLLQKNAVNAHCGSCKTPRYAKRVLVETDSYIHMYYVYVST